MFLGFAIQAVYDQFWPGILLSVGVPLSLNYILLGKIFQAIISLFVFIGVFLSQFYDFAFSYYLAVIFGLAAVYFFAREFIGPVEPEESEAEIEEDLNHEIEEHSTSE